MMQYGCPCKLEAFRGFDVCSLVILPTGWHGGGGGLGVSVDGKYVGPDLLFLTITL